MIFLSIVIPCYNAAATIQDTLDCLVNEIADSCNYEIIVVNDGSTDESAKIVEGIIARNPNVKLFNKENSGVSDTRNFGLKQASGEYVWFFDADDLCFNGAIREMIILLQEKNPDICSFNSVTVDKHTKQKIDSFTNTSTYTIVYEGPVEKGLQETNIPFACWASAVKREFLIKHNVNFNPELCISEDILWNFDLSRCSPKAKLLKTNLRVVKYIVNSGSIVNNVNSKIAEKQLVSYLTFAHHLQSLKKDCPDYLDYALKNQEQNLGTKLYARLLSSKTSIKESKRYLREINDAMCINMGG